jgi:multidrug efflux pump subunit AcrA (membrane-fusion protein)
MKNTLIISILAIIILTSCGKKYEETRPIRKDVTETVFASGALEANETYNLTALSDGYLTEISFKENDLVKQGQLLAVIDNKQIFIIQKMQKSCMILHKTIHLPIHHCC